MLQPEKYEAQDRNQEIAVENDAGVAGGKIVRRDHLIDVHAGRTPQKARRGDDGGEPQVEAAFEGPEAHHRHAQAGEANLRLEWTVVPADKGRRLLPEEDVHDEIVEVGKSN